MTLIASCKISSKHPVVTVVAQMQPFVIRQAYVGMPPENIAVISDVPIVDGCLKVASVENADVLVKRKAVEIWCKLHGCPQLGNAHITLAEHIYEPILMLARFAGILLI